MRRIPLSMFKQTAEFYTVKEGGILADGSRAKPTENVFWKGKVSLQSKDLVVPGFPNPEGGITRSLSDMELYVPYKAIPKTLKAFNLRVDGIEYRLDKAPVNAGGDNSYWLLEITSAE